jgi:hypothetical protein
LAPIHAPVTRIAPAITPAIIIATRRPPVLEAPSTIALTIPHLMTDISFRNHGKEWVSTDYAPYPQVG